MRGVALARGRDRNGTRRGCGPGGMGVARVELGAGPGRCLEQRRRLWVDAGAQAEWKGAAIEAGASQAGAWEAVVRDLGTWPGRLWPRSTWTGIWGRGCGQSGLQDRGLVPLGGTRPVGRPKVSRFEHRWCSHSGQ